MSSRTETTEAFDEWRAIDQDQRAFLTLGLRFACDAYQDLWDQIGREPSDGEAEQDEVFDQRVDGLWPHDYEWMHLAAVVRDAVTSYEMYIGKACSELLHVHGAQPGRELRWGDLGEIFKQVNVKIDRGPVKRIRKIRHVLTHQRGELRTEELRRQYAISPNEKIPSYVIDLSEERVLGMLDQMGEIVAAIDAAVCRYTWSRETSEALSEYLREQIASKDTGDPGSEAQ
jgi:hypothetical protein